MTHKEKQDLKIAKANHKAAKQNKVRFLSERNKLIKQIIDSDAPKFGSIKLLAFKY